MHDPDFGFFRLVIRNLRNRPWRNLAAVLAFAIIAGTLFSAQYLMNGAKESLDSGIDRLGADIMVVPAEYSAAGESVLLTGRPTSFYFQDESFAKIAEIPGVAKASPEIFIGTLYGHSCCSGAVQIIAIDPARDFTIASWLQENPGLKMGKDDVIVGNVINGDIGSDLLFYGHTFHILGRMDMTGLPGVDMAVFTRAEDAYVMAAESGKKAAQKLTIPPGMVSAVLVRVEPGVSRDEVAANIRNSVPGTKTITPDGLMNSISSQLGAITLLLYGSTIAVTTISVPLLGFISAMVAHERRKEVALMRALGAPGSFVFRLMAGESLSLAIIGGLTGITVAALLLAMFQDLLAVSLKIPFGVPSLPSILWGAVSSLLLTVAIGGIATLWPTMLVSRSEPWETIRKGPS